ncbi:NAD(P)-dependent oxidoreductase [Paenibacillus vini]|uniref:NAD-dependent epimerase/dehydratase family protein n=1 Tax=Paenibacillus vini TaxID=1476024 RepID=UPI0025B71045|nr:NAD(P)-dependent oxidoreductase [Paenibacillus vini]MDN4066520.1 NAD(P)-dependent oxidoreductase [Paenibacillus vini]
MIKKALVTGATGFIGSNLVAKLLEDGWQVSIIVRKESNLDHLVGTKSRIKIFSYDGTVERMLEIMSTAEPDIVFHLASLFLAEHKAEDINSLFQSNILFGTHLLEAMVKNDVKMLINTGTSWQHFENYDYNPVCLYAATKQAYEDILAYYVNAKEIKAITLKLFDTYGSKDPRPKLLAFLKKMRYSNDILEMSGGDQIINLVHINDVIKAYLMGAERLLNNLVTDTETYAVSSDEVVSLKQLVKIIETFDGENLPIKWGARAYRNREVMTPWSKGIRLPGWEAEITLRDGLREYFLES